MEMDEGQRRLFARSAHDSFALAFPCLSADLQAIYRDRPITVIRKQSSRGSYFRSRLERPARSLLPPPLLHPSRLLMNIIEATVLGSIRWFDRPASRWELVGEFFERLVYCQ